MKKLLLVLLMFAGMLPEVRGQFDAALAVGVSFPVAGSANAPDLNTCFAGSLGLGWRLGTESPWRLELTLDGLHWTSATSLDENGMFSRRYLFFPLTVGVSYDFRFSAGLTLRTLAAVGGYYRYQNCLREEHPGVLGDFNDVGMGFAFKASVALLMLEDRIGLGLNFMALGNPFETEQTSFPDRNPAAVDIVRLNTTLRGFWRCFVGLSLGYRFF